MEHLDFFGFFFNSRIFLGFYCGLQNYGIIEILDQWNGSFDILDFLGFLHNLLRFLAFMDFMDSLDQH